MPILQVLNTLKTNGIGFIFILFHVLELAQIDGKSGRPQGAPSGDVTHLAIKKRAVVPITVLMFEITGGIPVGFMAIKSIWPIESKEK